MLWGEFLKPEWVFSGNWEGLLGISGIVFSWWLRWDSPVWMSSEGLGSTNLFSAAAAVVEGCLDVLCLENAASRGGTVDISAAVWLLTSACSSAEELLIPEEFSCRCFGITARCFLLVWPGAFSVMLVTRTAGFSARWGDFTTASRWPSSAVDTVGPIGRFCNHDTTELARLFLVDVKY